MPPKGRKPKSKLHSLAIALNSGTIITDTRKQCFVIEKEFAQGGFGRIYSGHMKDSRDFGKSGSLAIKIEPKGNGPLFTEITVFQRILKLEMMKEWQKRKCVEHLGLPPHVGTGIFVYEGEELRFLAMPKYGRSFESYRIECDGKIESSIALQVGRQCVDCLAYMQDQDYVHADLKADNILLASEKAFPKCYLVDFGLARMIKCNVDKPDKKRAHNGTLIFTSLDAHRGCCPSPRGDLEILAYNILYWIAGYLPWEQIQNNPENVYYQKTKFAENVDKNVREMIKGSAAECIVQILKMVYQLPYTEKIDYDFVKKKIDVALECCRFSGRKNEESNRSRKFSSRYGKGSEIDSSLIDEAKPCSSATNNVTSLSLRKRLRTDANIILGKNSSIDNNVEMHSSRQSGLNKLAEVEKSSASKRSSENSKKTNNSSDSRMKKRSHERNTSESPDFIIKAGKGRRRKIMSQSNSSDDGLSTSIINGTKNKFKIGNSDVIANPPVHSKTKEERRTPLEHQTGILDVDGKKKSFKASGEKSNGSTRILRDKSSDLESSTLNSSRLTAEKSEISSIIPGVRNMKKIRRSLNAKLVKKYKEEKK